MPRITVFIVILVSLLVALAAPDVVRARNGNGRVFIEGGFVDARGGDGAAGIGGGAGGGAIEISGSIGGAGGIGGDGSAVGRGAIGIGGGNAGAGSVEGAG